MHMGVPVVCVCVHVWCQLWATGQAAEVWAGDGKARAAHPESPWPCSCQVRKLQLAALDGSERLLVLLAVELSRGVVHPVKV